MDGDRRGYVSGQFRVRDLMSDERDLARRARTTLAGSDSGVLLVAAGGGPAACAELPVAVRDDAGEPVVDVLGAELPGWPGGRGWHTALFLAANLTYGVGVTLVGLLRPRSSDSAPGEAGGLRLPVEGRGDRDGPGLFDLAVERVLVSCPRGGRPSMFSDAVALSLDQYAAAEPDLIAANCPRIAAHLNGAHGDLLRARAAALAGRPLQTLIAAEITMLCRSGLRLRWVDAEGGNTTLLDFPSRATTLTELAGSLAAALELSDGLTGRWPPAAGLT